MAHKSAMGLVLSQQIPVDPSGSQPPYFRSKRSVQTSGRLRAFQTCISDALEGQTFGSRGAVREAFAQAAQDCRGGG